MNDYNSTTELPEQIQYDNNTAVLIKTHATVLLARPIFINLSATQFQWAAIFPQKATMTVCLGLCFHPSMVEEKSYR